MHTNSSVAVCRVVFVLTLLTFALANERAARADEAQADDDLAAAIRAIPPRTVTPEEATALADAVRVDVRARMKAAEDRESKAWYEVKSAEDWSNFQRPRIEALGRSIKQDRGPAGGMTFSVAKSPEQLAAEKRPPLEYQPQDLRTTSRIDGAGFTIENLMFTSRPGLVVTGNLYRPKESRKKLPGILICHSHHAPKTQGELQDMGMTWARHGCAVLVIDMLGHGERRTHDFAVDGPTAGKFAGAFRPSRQDYFFRYNTGLQLAAVGESLLGWMVHDLRCGATLLGNLPEVDPQSIILLGAVAGGGDPVGVAGALDWRFAAVVPFNFGGYEPEDGFPLPDDAEKTFRYSGGLDWESTRSLRHSAKDGFMPWTIVASIAPRRLIYAHEFRWDEPRDPVWRRLQSVFEFYGVREQLGTIVGHGGVKQSSSEASHCTNIGPVHRAQLYPLLEKGFGLAVPQEYSARRESEELRALPKDFTPTPLHETLKKIAADKLAAARSHRPGSLASVRERLRSHVGGLLGPTSQLGFVDIPTTNAAFAAARETALAGCTYVRFSATLPSGDRTVTLPLIVLRPTKEVEKSRKPATGSPKPTLVVAVAQGGKERLLKERADVFAACLARGATVVVCDLRGTGELEPREEGRGRTGGATSRSVAEQMLGETSLGLRVRDLRSILHYLVTRDEFNGMPIALYGDGLSPANDPKLPIAAPHGLTKDVADLPQLCEPLGTDACLLAGLYDDYVDAIYAGGGLVSQASILEAPYFYVPHDAIVPGVAATADTADLIAAQSARVWAADLRDGANRPITEEHRASAEHDIARFTPPSTNKPARRITLGKPPAKEIAEWLVR